MQSDKIKKLLEDNPHSISLQLQYADMLMQEKSYKKARTELESVQQKDEFNPKVYFLLAKIAKGGAAALEYYEKALNIDSNDKDTLWAACNVLKSLINLKSARNWMDENITKAKQFSYRLLKISKQNEKPEVYKYMAFIARKERNTAKAIEYLEKAAKIFPDDVEIFIEMSILFREIRIYDYALRTAKKVVSLDPENWEGYYDAGLAMVFMGRYEEAAENFKKAIEKKPNYHHSYSQLGKCYLSLGNYKNAEKNYQKAIELFPNSRPALFGLTYAFIDTGKYDAAIENFKILFKRKYFNKSEFVLQTALSTLRDRPYLNMDTLPNIANYFKLAGTETGWHYADQLETFYRLSKNPEAVIKTSGWDGRVIDFFDTYKKFLQLSPKENLETRRKAYAAVQKILKGANTSLPILHFLSRRWLSVENYLNRRYGISPHLILNFKIKSNLLVNQIVKFEVSIINQGVNVANKVFLTLQKSEKFSIDKYDFNFEKIGNQKTFSVEFEPLEEGPLQLTAATEIENYGTFKTTYDLIAFRKNPYFYGRPVHSAEMFFGRTELKERIIARLTNVVKQDIILTGIRRIGKTSLLYQLKNALKPPFFPILFSLQQVGNVEDDVAILRQLFLEILDGLESQEPKLGFTLRTIDKPILENIGTKEFDMMARNFRISYENLIEKLKKMEPGIRIVVLMDEGDYLFKVQARCQNFFRDLLQKYDRFVMVLAGSPIIRELSGHDFSSPFFNIFAKYDIKGLKKEEVLDLINRPMEAADMQVEKASQESIYRLCGGHPHFLQAICYYLVEGMYKKRKKIIGTEELDMAKYKVLDELKESFKGIWNELNNDEKFLLNRLANESISIIKAKKLLSVERIEHLIQFELVNKSDSELSIYSDLIKQWTLDKLI